MPTNTEHTPQPRGSAPRPRNVAPSLSICSGCGKKACGMPQRSLSKAPLLKKNNNLLNTHTTQVEKGKFIQVQSPDDLIQLAVRGAVTLRPSERGSSEWLDENLLCDDKGVSVCCMLQHFEHLKPVTSYFTTRVHMKILRQTCLKGSSCKAGHSGLQWQKQLY